MTRKAYPEFHKALLDQRLYPSAKRRIKFQETRTSYLYKAGDFVYKILKERPGYAGLALKEVFAQDALATGKRWAPEIYHEVLPIVRVEGGYALGGEGPVVDFALRLTQLSDHYWMSRLLPEGKFTPTAVGRVARYLAEHHLAGPMHEKHPEAGRPEHLRDLGEEIFYQARKHLEATVGVSLLDMVSRPFFKFIEDYRKLFQRRLKKERLVDCHGAFIPEHIYIRGRAIHAMSPLPVGHKFRVLDAANDLATLINELALAEAQDSGELFVKRYMASSHDREVVRMLPAYRTLHAMRSGLLVSERQADPEVPEGERPELMARAQRYFNLALQAAREIPR